VRPKVPLQDSTPEDERGGPRQSALRPNNFWTPICQLNGKHFLCVPCVPHQQSKNHVSSAQFVLNRCTPDAWRRKLALMTQRFIVVTHGCRPPVCCAIWGISAGSWGPLDRCHFIKDGASVGNWSSISCSLGSRATFSLPVQGSCYFGSWVFLSVLSMALISFLI